MADYRRDRKPQTMHEATCSQCGKRCEVPFLPTGSKPVLCRDCFKQSSPAGNRERKSSGRFQKSDREMYDAHCSNCGTGCKIPFRPTSGRDVFCSRCFEAKQTLSPGVKKFDKPPLKKETHDYSAQLAAINAKMDKILEMLTKLPEEKKTPDPTSQLP